MCLTRKLTLRSFSRPMTDGVKDVSRVLMEIGLFASSTSGNVSCFSRVTDMGLNHCILRKQKNALPSHQKLRQSYLYPLFRERSTMKWPFTILDCFVEPIRTRRSLKVCISSFPARICR